MTAQTLDIRNIPPAKGEPFTSIMAAVNALPTGESLLLIAPFKPEPLLRLLESRGFDNVVTHLPDGTWQVLFSPKPLAQPDANPADPLTWPKPAALIDLSGTPSDDNARTVLAAVEDLAPRQVLFALLPGEPTDLRSRLFEGGHASFGRWQEGTYRIMVLRGETALS